MPVTSKNGIVINDAYWLRKNAVVDGVPADCVRAYHRLLNMCIGHFKELIDKMIQSQGGSIQVPMQPEMFERYLTGFTFEYCPLTNLPAGRAEAEGWWMLGGEQSNHVRIFYNQLGTSGRQRFTKIHELFHFAQTTDPLFLDFLDELILNTTLPENVIVKILERATDKATVMYLMPNQFFVEKFQEINKKAPYLNPQQVIRCLASAFDVSIQSATYRLQECNAYALSAGRNDM